MPSFKKSLIAEQFQGNYLKRKESEMSARFRPTEQKRLISGGALLYGLYRYVRPQRVGFFNRFDHHDKQGMVFSL